MANGECGLINATIPNPITLGSTINIPWTPQSSYNKTLNYMVELINGSSRSRLYSGYLSPGMTSVNTGLWSVSAGNYELNIVANDGVTNSTNRNQTIIINLASGGPGTGSGIGDTGCPNGYVIKDGLCVPIKTGIKEIVTSIQQGEYNNYLLWGFMIICIIGILFFVEKRDRNKVKEHIKTAKGKIDKGKCIIKNRLKEEGLIPIDDDDEEDKDGDEDEQ